MRQVTLLAGATLCLVLAGCSADDDTEGEALPAYCNPLSVDRDACMLPWPSSFYLKQDSSTKTGYRVAYPIEAMPENRDNKPLDPARYNLLDGFSTGSQPVVYFPEGVSADGLPGDQVDLAASVTASSLVQVLHYPGGERVPLFAELDANGRADEVPALIIRPQIPLEHNSRYVVLLRRGLKDAQGAELKPPAPFARLRDGKGTSNATLEGERARIDEVLDFLEQQQVQRDDVVLAWDFRTTSQEAVTGNVVSMVDGALAKLPAGGPTFTVVKSTDFDAATDPYIMREIEGEMDVPSYLESDAADARLKLDAEGKPVYRGTQKFPFYVHIPRCAEQATGPLPVLIFGPGLFSNPQTEINHDYNKQMVQELCMVEASAQWRGLSNVDAAAVAAEVIPDFSNLPRITDQLQQGHVNYQVLAELMAGDFLKDAAMQVAGKSVTDGQEMYYLGISNGGIQGVTFSALSKRIKRFVFHVSGGWWSQMIQRSSNFGLLAVLLEKVYPLARQRAMMVGMSQHLFDYTDPISFGRLVQQSPLPGRQKKLVVMQESRYDDQVPNLATRGVARAIGLTQMEPKVETIYGLQSKSGPLESGITQWSTNPPVVPPKENTPAAKPDEEVSAHYIPRSTQSFRDQAKAFLQTDGKLVNVCSGICDPN